MKKLLKNDYALSLFSKVFGLVIGLLTSAFLTRFLGLTYKGEYAYINQAVNVAGLILNLGIYQSYSYYFRQRGESVFQDYTAISVVQFSFYLFVAIVISIFSTNWQITVISLMVPFQVLRLQMDNIMIVQNVRIRLYTNMVHSVVLMLCYCFLYFFVPSGVLPVVIVVSLMDILVSVSYFISSKTRLNLKKFSFDRLKEVLIFGFLPMLSALLVTLNYSVDIFFLKRIGTAYDLSIYSVAAGIMSYVWIVPDSFKDILFSRVARNDKKNSVALSTKISLCFLIVVTIGFAVLGRLFIRVMYGAEFLPVYGVTLVLFLGVFSMVFYKIFGIVFLAEGKRRAYFIILLISVILNVILNYFLIPIYGMYGAAWASVGSYNLCGILFLFYFSKVKNIPISDLLILTKSDIVTIAQSIKNK